MSPNFDYVDLSSRLPRTFHYHAGREFIISGQTVRRRSKFLPQNL
jgi:hypothetical protein